MNLENLQIGFDGANAPWASRARGNTVSARELAASTAAKNRLFKDPQNMAIIMNAGVNTIDSTLQIDAVLNATVADFARRLLPLNAFSTAFHNIPLLGSNKVQVPYYALDSGASTSFKHADGYVAGDTAVDNREIQIGKRADADVLDDTKQYDRKYQALSLTSEEFRRQPFLNIVQSAKMKAAKLASDILNHVLGIINAANYGAAAVTTVAPLFDSEDLADLKLACKDWDEGLRSLVLDSEYDAALLKDSTFKSAMNAGTDRAIREGKIAPIVFGFNYFEHPSIPENGEGLKGFAAHKAAILFAQAPVPPSAEVVNGGTTYSVATDPASGVSLEYRSFGDSQADRAVHIIEASYGFAKGNGNALKRITT